MRGTRARRRSRPSGRGCGGWRRGSSTTRAGPRTSCSRLAAAARDHGAGREPAGLAHHRHHPAVPGPAAGPRAGAGGDWTASGPRPTRPTRWRSPTPSASRCRWCWSGSPRPSGWPSSCTTRSASSSRPSPPRWTPRRWPRASSPRGPGPRSRQPAAEDRLADLGGRRRLHGRGPGGRLRPAAGAARPRRRRERGPRGGRAGTPERIEGRSDVAAFFNGSAHAALPVFAGDRPGAAWFHRGRPAVAVRLRRRRRRRRRDHLPGRGRRAGRGRSAATGRHRRARPAAGHTRGAPDVMHG